MKPKLHKPMTIKPKATPEPTSATPESVSPADLAMLMEARAGADAARAVLDFVGAQIGARYSLGQGDIVTQTGQIVRAASADVR